MTFLKNSSKQEEQFRLRREKQERSLVLIYFSKIPAHDLAEQKAEQHCSAVLASFFGILAGEMISNLSDTLYQDTLTTPMMA